VLKQTDIDVLVCTLWHDGMVARRIAKKLLIDHGVYMTPGDVWAIVRRILPRQKPATENPRLTTSLSAIIEE